ncbi:hypothetical protein N7452_004603 [Penicillium brevicompactum]|uniref:Uncharacterized protein n=1 Tax=Penicillium brevicompactum TaxID=5074 RepID=A0A9W9QH77_PENBR|nr:hypothetical protein N7452_004603 [Penicillium brevicompactum]
MTDIPESPRRRLISAQTSSTLQYPTLPPLTASVEEWLSRSRPTNMTSARLSDSPKSLSDSWATLSVSDLHSEDGSHSEQTDTCSLIDQAIPDDVASLDERYSSSDAEHEDNQDEDSQDEEDDGIDKQEVQCTDSASQELPALFASGGAAIDDSTITTKPSYPKTSDSIEFVEPEMWPEIERVELKHTIRIFEGAAASELKSRLPYNSTDSILMATVQQTMTKQSLDLDKPFRVLYIGHPGFRNIILDKIGDVLVSSSGTRSEASSAESSRYHVVPTSFGAGAIPTFAELLPIHVQLVVDECLEATDDKHADRPSTLNLRFKNRPSCTSAWNGIDFGVSSTSDWTLPDVAILFVSKGDNESAVRTQRLAHTFLERHEIPAMVISEEPMWTMAGEMIPLNHDSLHTCLESRHPLSGETAVLRRYPIDLKTFESITAGQLNRNLASLVGLYPKRAHKVAAQSHKPAQRGISVDLEKYTTQWLPPAYATKVREMSPTLRVATLSLISIIAVSLGYLAVQLLISLLAQCIVGASISSASLPVASQVSSASIPTLDQVNQTPIAMLPSSSVRLLHVPSVGDSIPDVRLSALFDGVYTLKLNREDAYGLVNLTITPKTRRPVNQTIILDFGTPWLKISNWKRAAQGITAQFAKDLHTAQTGLTEVYGRFSTDLQVLMGDVVKKAHFLRRDAESLRNESLSARNAVLVRSKQMSDALARNAVQRLQIVCSALQMRTTSVNKEAKSFVHDAWARLESSAPKVDLRSVMDRMRGARKCEALDRAQSRARYVMKIWSGKPDDCSTLARSK